MPEGPSIVILKELTEQFVGKKILEAGGSAKIDMSLLEGQMIVAIRTWGKHYLICLKDVTVRIHLMLFGSYRINEERDANPRLSLKFKKGSLNFYACSVKLIEDDLDDVYDWSADIMSDKWSATSAKKKLKAHPDMLACDALLDQEIFSGSGNIIKCEVLWRVRLHPLTPVGNLPAAKLTELIKETRHYAFDFLEWKKQFVLRKHWAVYSKKKCPRCHIPVIKEVMGKTKRRTFYCNNCQLIYE